VRLAAEASRQLVAGERVHTGKLVVSLRDFIRQSLDLAPIPEDAGIPAQGPARPQGSGSRGNQGDGRRGGGGGMAMGAGGDGGTTLAASDSSASSSQS
jgi:hypothetical protein